MHLQYIYILHEINVEQRWIISVAKTQTLVSVKSYYWGKLFFKIEKSVRGLKLQFHPYCILKIMKRRPCKKKNQKCKYCFLSILNKFTYILMHFFTASSISVLFLALHLIGIAKPPSFVMSLTTSWIVPGSESCETSVFAATPTEYPFLDKVMATCLPIPREAPITSADFMGYVEMGHTCILLW